jgi:hypothetical protein
MAPETQSSPLVATTYSALQPPPTEIESVLDKERRLAARSHIVSVQGCPGVGA